MMHARRIYEHEHVLVESNDMVALRMENRRSPPTHPQSRIRTVASYEHALETCRHTEIELREKLAREESLLLEKDNLILKLKELSTEADHRLLNNVQMIVSLLSLQSRRASNPEAASQLALAANRVATIGHVHTHLHSCDGVQTVAFKQYAEDLCHDFSTILSPDDHPEQVVVVEGSEIHLPAATAIPLGFIVNELITNAAKHGKGRITVRLGPSADKGYALSVSNDGPALSEGFDPAASKGLGMTIIQSFIRRIDAKLQIDRGDNNDGTRFTVLFS
jgi:two-component sensor histidine kinase